MSRILLVSATDLEHGHSHLYDHEIHITGIGKVSAAVETARLIKEYKPGKILPSKNKESSLLKFKQEFEKLIR